MTARRFLDPARRPLLAGLWAGLVALVLSVAAVPTAAAAPAWSVLVEHAPTHFAPGGTGQYVIDPFNVGDANITSGTYTTTIDLPPGVTATGWSPQGTLAQQNWNCDIAADPVTCTRSANFFNPVRSPAADAERRGQVGAKPTLVLDVSIHPLATGTATTTVTQSGGGGSPATATVTDEVTFADSAAGFGFLVGSFSADIFDSEAPTGKHGGTPVRQAGAHPFELRTRFKMNLARRATSDGSPYTTQDGTTRTLETRLPAGFVGNPEATPKCPAAGLTKAGPGSKGGGCPINAQVGTVDLLLVDGTGLTNHYVDVPVYNVEPPEGAVAALGFSAVGHPVYITITLDPEDGYSVVATIKYQNETFAVRRADLALWGVPGDPAHDRLRLDKDSGGATAMIRPFTGAPIKPYLTMPSQCDTGGAVRARAESWQNTGLFTPWETGTEIQATGCDDPRFEFEPTITVRPEETTPATPTGLDVELTVPQKDDVVLDAADLYADSGADVAIATPPLRDARVVLPEGMTVSPSSADGLRACSPSQIAMGTNLEPDCPNASKIGTVSVETPLLAEPLEGSIYVAAQGDNPFGSLLAIYVVAKGEGVLIKLAGKVTPDPVSGRLTTTFDDNPQLPFSKMKLHFMGGARAPLVTPATCGTKTTAARFTSWNSSVPTVDVTDSFAISGDGNGAPCPPRGFEPGFSGGTVDPVAGDYSPFVARVTRGSDQKELGRVLASLPQGALADLSHVEVCSGAQLTAAVSRSGRAVQSGPACPVGSQVGTTTIGAGSGAPFYPRLPGTNVSGRVFLTEPHTGTDLPVAGARQAAYGLAFEVPAVAGPFDLGNVLVRAALFVDPTTARLSVVSDTLPRILEGIPLDVRDVRVNVDRRNFATTPTSCEPMAVDGDIRAQDGTRALRSARYQVGGCADLGFRPRLALRLVGPRQRRSGGHPALRAVVRQSGLGEAGIRRAVVRLPGSLALDPDNARGLCEFEDGTKPDLEDRCPTGSVVGRARAVSPLLKRPLVGNVYFVKNVRIDPDTGNRIRTLPMIVAALRGEVAVNLVGHSSTTSSGRLVNTFAQVPDAPISRFNLNLKGGRNGILVVTETARGRIDLCATKATKASTGWRAHNGTLRRMAVRMRTPCRRANRKRRLRLRKAAQRRQAAQRRAAAQRRNG